MSKPAIVAYRRTSSDMEMSSSEEEPVSDTYQKSDDNDNRCISMDLEGKPKSSDDERAKRSDDRRAERSGVRRDDKCDGDRDRDRTREGDRERRRDSDDKSRRRRSRTRTRSRSPYDRRRKHSVDRHRSSSSYKDRRRSPDRHRSRRSPDSFRSRRLERKAARIDKLGLELYAEPKPGVVVNVPCRDGSVFGFANASPAARITEQIQKRRLLWQNKKEAAPEQSEPSSSKTWEAATFKGDDNGRVTEKFKRLMGIKGDGQATSKDAAEGNSINQKQEEMFSNMEAQYQVARMATHTHRGIGLGFGTFQVPPR